MNNNIENRVIRIFISSTFRDMEAEREYLRTKVFPRLQDEAAKRDVTLIPLDLRWGITPEQSKSGKVLEVCLREIENSHPFFIGMVGDRYGWCPTTEELKKNEYLRERYDWISDDIDHGLSVTEMEMQYGVLRNPDEMNAFFFIKEGTHGIDNPEKLEKLKTEIRSNKRYPVYDYSSVEEIGKQVEKDFSILLNRLFPDGELSQLEKDRLAQKSFIHSRCEVYIKNAANYKRLDDWYNGSEPSLVVTGQSGMGKSALIANWLTERKESLGKVIYHFVGNGGLEGNYEAIAQRLCREIRDLYGLEQSKKADRKKPEERLNDLFMQIAGREQLLVVLDGINQLADIDNAKLLNWLPRPTRTTRYLFSTILDDQTMEVLTNRNYPKFVLKPLNCIEKRLLVQEYLKRLSKNLPEEFVNCVIDNKKCENTLVLRTLLDELANYGNHEKLSERIDYYLSAESINEFFQKVLSRYEDDYGKDTVTKFFSLIIFSRRGMTEQELLDITGSKHLDWSIIRCAISMHLTTRNGLISFSHKYMTNAALSRYAGSEKKVRIEIISHFGKRTDNRACDELPYQYYTINDHKSLHSYLVNLDVFDYIYYNDSAEIAKYWRYLLKTDSKLYKLTDYLPLSSEKNDFTVYVYNYLAVFVNDYFSNIEIALDYLLKSLKIGKTVLGDKNTFIAILYYNIGTTYYRQGDQSNGSKYLSSALRLEKSLLSDCQQDDVSSFMNIGSIYYALKDYDKALEFFEKALEIGISTYGEMSEKVALSCNYIGRIYNDNSNFTKAIEYYLKSLQIFKSIYGDKNLTVAAIYYNIAEVYYRLEDYDNALELNIKALNVNIDIYGDVHPDVADSYDAIGMILDNQKDYISALDNYLKALNIRKVIYGVNNDTTIFSYNHVTKILDYFVFIYMNKGDYKSALEYSKQLTEIGNDFLGVDSDYTIASWFDTEGEIYFAMGDYQNDIKCKLKALSIHDKINMNDYNTARICYNIGQDYNLIYHDFEKALIYHQRALDIRREDFGDDNEDTIDSFVKTGYVLMKLGRYKESLEYLNTSLIWHRNNYYNQTVYEFGVLYGYLSECYAGLGDEAKAAEYRALADECDKE